MYTIHNAELQCYTPAYQTVQWGGKWSEVQGLTCLQAGRQTASVTYDIRWPCDNSAWVCRHSPDCSRIGPQTHCLPSHELPPVHCWVRKKELWLSLIICYNHTSKKLMYWRKFLGLDKQFVTVEELVVLAAPVLLITCVLQNNLEGMNHLLFGLHGERDFRRSKVSPFLPTHHVELFPSTLLASDVIFLLRTSFII